MIGSGSVGFPGPIWRASCRPGREGGSLGLWFAVGSSGACRRVGVPGFVITDQLALEGKKGLGLEVAGATVYTLGVLSLPLRLARDA